MILNNLALVIMEDVYRQTKRPNALLQAHELLTRAIQRSDELDGKFKWPIVNMQQLNAHATTFGVALPT